MVREFLMIYFFSRGIVCLSTGLEYLLLIFLLVDDADGFVVNFTFSGEYLVEAHPPEMIRVTERSAIRNRLIFFNFTNIAIIPVNYGICKIKELII